MHRHRIVPKVVKGFAEAKVKNHPLMIRQLLLMQAMEHAIDQLSVLSGDTFGKDAAEICSDVLWLQCNRLVETFDRFIDPTGLAQQGPQNPVREPVGGIEGYRLTQNGVRLGVSKLSDQRLRLAETTKAGVWSGRGGASEAFYRIGTPPVLIEYVAEPGVGVGQARIECDRASQSGDCSLAVLEILQCLAEIVVGQGKFRVERNCPFEACYRLRIVAIVKMHAAQPELDRGILRVQQLGFAEGGQGVGRSGLLQQSPGGQQVVIDRLLAW